jgi:hypothetical protein
MASLAMDDAELAGYKERFERARETSRVTMLDLDEVEQHTGCHSRAGESIYIDGITGRVSPCLRVPFAPDECNLEGDVAGRLADVLSHPFFVAYRNRERSCPSWCGANLEAELVRVGALLGEHETTPPERLAAYEERSRDAQGTKRRLPILQSDARP